MSKNNTKKKRNREKNELHGRLERKTLRKLVIIIPMIVLAGLSVFIFMSSRGESQGDISVEFSTKVIGEEDNSSRGENHLLAGREPLLWYRRDKTGKAAAFCTQ